MPSLEEVLEFAQLNQYPSVFFRKRRKTLKRSNNVYFCTKSVAVAQQMVRDFSKKWTVNYTRGSKSFNLPVNDNIAINDPSLKPHEYTDEEVRLANKYRKRETKLIPRDQKLLKILKENGTGLLRGMFKFTYVKRSNKRIEVLFSIDEIFLGKYIAKIINFDKKDQIIAIRLLDDPQIELDLKVLYDGDETTGDFLAMYKLNL